MKQDTLGGFRPNLRLPGFLVCELHGFYSVGLLLLQLLLLLPLPICSLVE